MPSADFFWSTHDETDTSRSIARARSRHRRLAARRPRAASGRSAGAAETDRGARGGAAGDLERASGAQGDAADPAAGARARRPFWCIGIVIRRVDAAADDAAVDSEFGVARIGD